jgi:hypothetical protein
MREKVSVTYIDGTPQEAYIIPDSFEIYTYNNYICILENGDKVYLNREQIKIVIVSQEE